MLQGTLVAMVTPFKEGGVDYGSLEGHVDRLIEAGVDGLVPVGTTGECPTLSHEEHEKVIETVVKQTGGRVPVVAGTGSNSTAEALKLTQFARNAGADAALMVNPYYNKPTQEGLYRHFRTVAEKVGLPIVLYNIPSRCGIAMTPDTVVRLAELEEIVAIKEATGSMDTASEIASRCEITILSGDDSMSLPLMIVGGKGVISVVANIAPKQVKAITSAALEGDFVAARQAHLKLFRLCKTMFIETNPIPVKTAMGMMGLCSDEVRLPLCPLTEANRERLQGVLSEYKLVP